MTTDTLQPATGTNRTVVHTTAILVIILISYFMLILDNSIVFTGLPTIQREMHFTQTQLTWVQDAYTLTFGGALLLGARAGDIVGRRRMFIIGLVVFTVASGLVGASPTGWWMIAARAAQGIGSAILAPTSLSLITSTFTDRDERSRAVALYSAVAGIGASLGMVVGGVTADLVSWRAGFFLNLPIGAVMIVLGVRYLVETRRAPGRFDVVGALTATIGVGALIFGVIESSTRGWASPVTLTAVIVGLVLLALLVVNEWRAEQPIMPLRLFRSPIRSSAYAIRFLYLGAMMGFFFFTTQFLQEVFGWTPLQAGLGFLPMSVVNFAVAVSVPRLLRRVPAAWVLVAGAVLTAIGMWWLAQVHVDSSFTTGVALPMVLIGGGQGLVFAPLTSFGIHGATASDAGAASGLVNTAHQLGSSLGLAVLVAVATTATAGSDAAAVVARTDTALTIATVFLVASAVIAVVVLPRADVRER
ncbi:MFS transporter [Curtobacterium sp. MCJR17_020]|uniref:MFS transporter n=1 Tax=Curtobacterium sp. MCJR17_020 TaxID=2175619 RepID=UPI0021AC85D6|nr:MFS transporter [Curtobacterium sp. MCJR17_020]WIE73905.1 MFS transporter [Curtobacterium sp. MCJR17_020]